MTLVEITPEKYNVEIDILYATSDNVMGKPIYKNPYCFLHENAALCLKKASDFSSSVGLKIKIYDAFRPLEAQRALWSKFPNPEFVSEPENGTVPHCRGVAVDMTLVDKTGIPIDMGTKFDEFTHRSHHGNVEISPEAQKNRHLLMGIMTVSGWCYNPNEWWHYQLPLAREYKKFTDLEAKLILFNRYFNDIFIVCIRAMLYYVVLLLDWKRFEINKLCLCCHKIKKVVLWVVRIFLCCYIK